MDINYILVAGGFVVAMLTCIVGLIIRKPWGMTFGPPPLPQSALPLPTSDHEPSQEDGPYTPPRHMAPVLSATGSEGGLWKVSILPFRWLDVLLVAFLVGVYALPIFMEPLGLMPDEELKIDTKALVATIFSQCFFSALVVAVMVWRVNLRDWLGLNSRRWWLAPLIAPIGVGLTWAFVAALDVTGFHAWLESQMGESGQQEMVQAFGNAQDPTLLVLMTFTAVIVAPIAEEFIFRGYIYGVSKRFLGRTSAIVFTSIIFAVIHHNAYALFPLIFLAVLLVLAYEFTGTIWVPIAMHMLFNGLTVAVQFAQRAGLLDLPQQ